MQTVSKSLYSRYYLLQYIGTNKGRGEEEERAGEKQFPEGLSSFGGFMLDGRRRRRQMQTTILLRRGKKAQRRRRPQPRKQEEETIKKAVRDQANMHGMLCRAKKILYATY